MNKDEIKQEMLKLMQTCFIMRIPPKVLSIMNYVHFRNENPSLVLEVIEEMKATPTEEIRALYDTRSLSNIMAQYRK